MEELHSKIIANKARKPYKPKCAVCRIELTMFTGTHVMTKESRTKTVCGLCSAQLELEGWREVSQGK